VGTIVATRHRLTVPPAPATGASDVRVPVWVTVPDGARTLPWRREALPVGGAGRLRLGSMVVRTRAAGLTLPVTFGDGLRLVGFDAPRRARPGERMWVRLTWEAAAPPERRYRAFVQLIDASQALRAGVDRELLHGTRPTDSWRQGEQFTDAFPLDVPGDLPAGGYRIQTGLYDSSSGERLANLDVAGHAVDDRFAFDVAVAPDVPAPLASGRAATFGQRLALVGFDASAAPVRPGGTLTVTLRWVAEAPAERDYTLFAHLVPAGEDRIVAQHDGPPFADVLPTSRWPIGVPLDVITSVTVPPDAPAGAYRLAVGWYDPATGERLAAAPPADGSGPGGRGAAAVAADRIELPVTVGGGADGSAGR
jgi:hypothetical protein